MAKIKFLTDSASDITEELEKKLTLINNKKYTPFLNMPFFPNIRLGIVN